MVGTDHPGLAAASQTGQQRIEQPALAMATQLGEQRIKLHLGLRLRQKTLPCRQSGQQIGLVGAMPAAKQCGHPKPGRPLQLLEHFAQQLTVALRRKITQRIDTGLACRQQRPLQQQQQRGLGRRQRLTPAPSAPLMQGGTGMRHRVKRARIGIGLLDLRR